jgi:hypothetical protein
MNVVPHLLIILPELYYWTFLPHSCQKYVTGLFSHIIARSMLLDFSPTYARLML